jgi:hypothetical protein
MAGFNPNTINLKAGLDTRGVATGVQQIQGHMGKMSKNVNKIKRSFGGLGGVIAGAFAVRSLVSFASSATLLAEETKTAKARIDSIAKSMGLFGDQTTKVTDAIKQYAIDNEALFATDRNVIMATQAKLLTFKELAKTAGELGGAFNRATQITIDMAAAGFGTATDNAVQLGKALNDPIKGISALSRSGITFTEQEKDKIRTLVESNKILEAQDMILKAIETQVGGTAEATADATVKMGIHFDKIKRQLGERLLPLVERFEKGFSKLNKNISKYGIGITAQVDPNVIRAMESSAAFDARNFAEGQKNAVVQLNLAQKRLGYEKKIGEIKERLAKVQEGSANPKENLRRMKMQVYYTNMLLLLNRDLDALNKTSGGGGTTPTPPTTPDPLSLQEQISIAKKSNKAISELESQGLSKAQVQALDTAFAINVMNDNLSQIPETLATIDSGLTGKPPLSEFQKGIEEMTENVRSMLEGLVTTIAVDFFGAIGEAMVAGGDSFKSFGQQTLEAMGRFFKQIGGMFISYGIAALEFFKTLLVPANAPALIAAGVALSLIGGAISGAAKNMAQTGQPSSAGVPAQSGGMGYNFETRIDGYDLVLVNDRNQRLRNRRG